jgi:asparagine synthase (glutamine-hydrolysing)
MLDPIANFPASLGPEGRSKVSRYLKEFDHLSSFQRATNLHTLFETEQIADLIHPDIRTVQQQHPITDSSEKNHLALQYAHWLPDWSLIRQDKNTMAHSLEYRAPFLDHRLIDFALAHPGAAEIHRGNKHIWRRLAARHLPTSITRRPKQPFYLPLEHPSWRKPLLAIAREILTPGSLARHDWLNFSAIEPLFSARTFVPLKQLAALVILQIWLDSMASD